HCRRLAAIALLLVAAPLRAQTTTAPAGFTDRDLIQAELRFNRRVFPQAYEQSGKRDPKWDDKAKAFLEAQALRIANRGHSENLQLPGAASLEESRKLGQAAIDAGCDDPLVRQFYCNVLLESGE